MFISAPPRVFDIKEKNFDDFEYENFETETNGGETGDIDDNFEDLVQHSEWIQSLDVPKIQKSQSLKILPINCTKNDTKEHYFDDSEVPKNQLFLSISISIFLCVTVLLLFLFLLYRRRKSMSLDISEPTVHNWKSQKMSHNFGTISSCGSDFTDSEFQDISSSFETIYADQFLTSLEDE